MRAAITVFPPFKSAVCSQIRSSYIVMIKAEACVAPIAIFLFTKAAKQMSHPDIASAVIMWGNDTVSREQMKTQKRM